MLETDGVYEFRIGDLMVAWTLILCQRIKFNQKFKLMIKGT